MFPCSLVVVDIGFVYADGIWSIFQTSLDIEIILLKRKTFVKLFVSLNNAVFCSYFCQHVTRLQSSVDDHYLPLKWFFLYLN